MDIDKKVNILVIGGAGFVGSHLCESLISNKIYNVISIDNYSSGTVDNHTSGVTYIEGDTRTLDEVNLPKFDYVYHLGEYSRVENSLEQVDQVIDNNIVGLTKVLKFCYFSNAKLIYAGSSTKFGDDGKTINETPYALTKWINTELIYNYCTWMDLEFCISYFYNVYGPRENEDGKFATVLGIFKRRYILGQPMPVVRPGTQRRNFTHVNDIVSGLILLLKAPSGDGYGIGAEEDFSIIDIAKLFSENIELLPARKGNRLGSSLVNSKIKELGWKQKHQLRDYIHDIKHNLEK